MSAVAYGSDNNFRNLKQFLNDEFGVILGQDQERQVTDKLDSVMVENSIDSLQSLAELLRSKNSPSLRTNVFHAITQYSTNWFNYPEIMSVFSDYVLPNFSKSNVNSYRVWVVGSGKGQTAYSLAIAADHFRKAEGKALSVEIIATDSSEETSKDATKAAFKESFLLGLNDADKSKYLTLENDEWVVNDSVKSMVTFSVLNPLFMGEEDMAKVDLIICPDIMTYYTVAAKSRVLSLFADMLNNSGILISGSHESIMPFSKQFTLVEHDSGIFYRKKN